MDKEKQTDIDYLHPDGKPESDSEENQAFDEHELEARAKSRRSTEIDTDGHHMCSADCQRSHKVKI